MNKLLSLSIATVLVLGALLFFYFNQNNTGNNAEDFPDNQETSEIQSEFDNTNDWNYFIHKKFGYEIIYPTDWRIREIAETGELRLAPIEITQDEIMSINVSPMPLESYIQTNDYLNETYNKLLEREEVSINGKKWVKLVFEDKTSDAGVMVNYLIENEGQAIDIGGYFTDEQLKVFNTILANLELPS